MRDESPEAHAGVSKTDGSNRTEAAGMGPKLGCPAKPAGSRSFGFLLPAQFPSADCRSDGTCPSQRPRLVAAIGGPVSDFSKTSDGNFMAYIVMAYIVMAYIVMAVYSHGLYSHGLYSYGLYIHGLYSYGLCSYGLYSYGPFVHELYSLSTATRW